MRFKKFLTCSVVVCLFLIIMSTPISAGITLRVIAEETPDVDIVKQLVPEFEKKTGIKVEIEDMAYEGLLEKMMPQFIAPTSTYNIVQVINYWSERFSYSGFLEPLSTRIAKTEGYEWNDFFRPIRENGMYKGVVYGLPFYNWALGLVVRQDIFDNAGIEVPTTVEEYLRNCKALTDRENNFYGVSMMAKRGTCMLEEAMCYTFGMGGVATLDSEGNVILDNEANIKGFKYYVENLFNSAPKGARVWAFDEAFRLMSEGQAASMITYNWMISALNDPKQTGELAGKYKLYETPGGKAVLGLWHWSIPKNAKDKDAAWEFISWLTSKEMQKRAALLGGAPVRKSVIDILEPEQYRRVLKLILEDAEPVVQSLYAEEITAIMALHMSRATAGQIPPEEALKAAAEEIRQLLAKAK